MSNYYDRSLKGSWYFMKTISKAFFFLSLGLLIGFILSNIEILKDYSTENKVKIIVAFVLMLLLSLVLWMFSRDKYYHKVEDLKRKETLTLLESLHLNGELSVNVMEREKGKFMSNTSSE